MPRYRIVKPVPAAIQFRNGLVLIDEYEGMYGGRFWRARKDQRVPYSGVILCRDDHLHTLDDLRRDGFEADSRHAVPVLDVLVRLGYAERLDGGGHH